MNDRVGNNNVVEIERLIRAYQALSPLLRKSEHSVLIRLAESWDVSIGQLVSRLAVTANSKELRAIKSGLRQGLRELPELFASVKNLDDKGLVIAAEDILGKRLSDF